MIKLIASFCEYVRRGYNIAIRTHFFKSRLGYCGHNVNFRNTNHCRTCDLQRVYLYDNTSIQNFTIITAGGKFVMKRGSGAAEGLVVITGNHRRELGKLFMHDFHIPSYEKDVIVEEDVWIGANVTLTSGVTVGRGATVAAGSVCTKSIPPYSIVMGNPAKIVGFTFTPDEIVNHESVLYKESERIPIDLLQKNYDKYLLKRIKEIKEYTNL